MRVNGVPNVRTCQIPVTEGMRVDRQDTGAIYGRPMQKILDTADALIPVGFYFKWFNRPALLSRLFLKGLRPVAGIGRLPAPTAWQHALAGQEDSGQEDFEQVGTGKDGTDWGRFDTVIIGAGISGMAATAQAAGRALLVDDHPEPGGQRRGAFDTVAKVLGEDLKQFPNLWDGYQNLMAAVNDGMAVTDNDHVTSCFSSRMVSGYRPDYLLLRHAEKLVSFRCQSLIWAAGALDVTGLFPGNDLPGMFGPRAMYRLLVRDGLDVKGQRVLVCGGGLDLWLTATLLHACGARVTVVLNQSEGREEVGAAMSLGWQMHIGLQLASARRQGDDRLILYFIPPDEGHTPVELDCHLAVVVNRAKPAYDVIYQLGADLVLDPTQGGYLPRGVQDGSFRGTLPGGLQLEVAGEAAGLKPAAVLKCESEESTP
jgi:sarcosine oxidase subunit alpha